MMKSIVGIAALVALFMTTGCGSGSGSYTPKPVKKAELEKINPEDGKLMFPAKVGNQWTYKVVSEQSINGVADKKTDELSFSITDVKASGATQLVTIETTLNGEKSGQQVWSVDDRGIFQVKLNEKDPGFDPPQPSLLFPLKEGKNFEWKGKGMTVVGSAGEQSFTGTLLGTQFVDTEMGTFSAIGVEAKGTFKNPQIKNDGRVRIITYWAKGVGLIRYRQETGFVHTSGSTVLGVQSISLKKYTLKN